MNDTVKTMLKYARALRARATDMERNARWIATMEERHTPKKWKRRKKIKPKP